MPEKKSYDLTVDPEFRDLIPPLNEEELKLLEPCGMGNRKPVFAARNTELLNGKTFGKKNQVYKCLAKDESGRYMDAIYFGDAQALRNYLKEKGKVHLIYSPEINEFNGRRRIQIIIQRYR